MSKSNPFRYFKTSPEIIRLAMMRYVRFPLSLRNVEDLLHERGIDISHETIRFRWNRCGPIFAADIRLNESSNFAIILIGNRIWTKSSLKKNRCWINNRCENSHLPFRRRERAMQRFRKMWSLQKFASIHSSVYNHFNKERHQYSRHNFKENRTAALNEWRQLCAA